MDGASFQALSLAKTKALSMMSNSAEDFPPHLEERSARHSCWTGSTPGESSVPQFHEEHLSDGEILRFPGPLMSAKMQKDELMRFIRGKCQECLLHLDKYEQNESYFFWLITEHFCNRNGKVIVAEISPLLFKGYGLLRGKLRSMEKTRDWCIPLLELICSTAPEDKHREAIIKMGDMFASRSWTYAAHICYVVAQVDLGSRPKFKLIGYHSVPDMDSSMREAMERTEVYEYVLSLTSGFGQTHFQEFKYAHAFELAEAGLYDQAFGYVEIIATTVLSFPHCLQGCVLEFFISLSEKLLRRKGEEEKPEWLINLRQLLSDRRGLSVSSNYQESSSESSYESISGSSSESSYESIYESIYESSYDSSSESQGSAHLQFQPSDHNEFDSKYTMGEMLGTGGFGSVYTGVRKADEKQVAIKCVAKHPLYKSVTIPGETRSVPLEVTLMEMVSKPPPCENVMELLEWFETSDFYILVMERPEPCTDLLQFCKDNNGQLSEPVARHVMWQAVRAARHCCDRGVFHRDIKSQNFLINTDTLEVKLIDFGCGNLLTNEPYGNFTGTQAFSPPEWLLCREYLGVPATVWSLGILLFELVCGRLPFLNNDEIIHGHPPLIPGLSRECCNLIMRCLERVPKSRPTFKEIQSHVWFNKSPRDTVQTSNPKSTNC